jgi:hypothetical protein
MIGKGAWKVGAHSWKATRSWMGRRGYATPGQHVHHGVVPQQAFRGTAAERVFNQPWNLKPLQPPRGVSMDTWHKMVEGKVPGLNAAERWWHGTPDMIRYMEISTGGRVINEADDFFFGPESP